MYRKPLSLYSCNEYLIISDSERSCHVKKQTGKPLLQGRGPHSAPVAQAHVITLDDVFWPPGTSRSLRRHSAVTQPVCSYPRAPTASQLKAAGPVSLRSFSRIGVESSTRRIRAAWTKVFGFSLLAYRLLAHAPSVKANAAKRMTKRQQTPITIHKTLLCPIWSPIVFDSFKILDCTQHFFGGRKSPVGGSVLPGDRLRL